MHAVRLPPAHRIGERVAVVEPDGVVVAGVHPSHGRGERAASVLLEPDGARPVASEHVHRHALRPRRPDAEANRVASVHHSRAALERPRCLHRHRRLRSEENRRQEQESRSRVNRTLRTAWRCREAESTPSRVGCRARTRARRTPSRSRTG